MSSDPFGEGGREVSPDLFDAAGRLKWPFDDLHRGKRLAVMLEGECHYVPGRGWGVWVGSHFDFERGSIRMLTRASEALRRAFEEEAALAKGQPVSEAQIAAVAAERGIGAEAAQKAVVEERVARYRKVIGQCGNVAPTNNALEMAREAFLADVEDFDRAHRHLVAANGDIALDVVAEPAPEAEEEEERLARLRRALVPHDRGRRATRQLRVAYRPGAACPRWEWFVRLIQPDPAQRAYLHRALGYLCAGGNEAQVALMFIGEGGNGKSSVIKALWHVFGRYSAAVRIEMFLETKTASSEGASPSEARLPGVRVYLATEPEQSAVLSSSKVKGFTGGDAREARQLREAPFEWCPGGVPVISFNRVPRIKDDSGGLWRRIMPVLFPVVLAQLPAEDRRPEGWLDRVVEEEAEGILMWLLEGYAAFRARGFDPPPEVLAKKALMRATADPVGSFIAECVDLVPGYTIAARELHGVFEEWCAADGTEPFGLRPFKRALVDKGFTSDKTKGGVMHWRGMTWAGSETARTALARWMDREASR